MARVNETVRKAVKEAMKDEGVTQEKLASEIGIHRVQVNRLLNGKSNEVPDSWLKILDKFGLELTVKPKAPDGES